MITLGRLLASYSAFVTATMASVIVSGEVLPLWVRFGLAAFAGSGAAAGILAKPSGERDSDAPGKSKDS